jgi:hypothetical protein
MLLVIHSEIKLFTTGSILVSNLIYGFHILITMVLLIKK